MTSCDIINDRILEFYIVLSECACVQLCMFPGALLTFLLSCSASPNDDSIDS